MMDRHLDFLLGQESLVGAVNEGGSDRRGENDRQDGDTQNDAARFDSGS